MIDCFFIWWQIKKLTVPDKENIENCVRHTPGGFVQISKDLVAFRTNDNISFPGNSKSRIRRKKSALQN